MNEEEFGPQQSPTPHIIDAEIKIPVRETMNFYDALKAVIKEKKVHKLEWKDKEYYGFLKDSVLTLHKPDGKLYQWLVNDGDITGEDWVVVE